MYRAYTQPLWLFLEILLTWCKKQLKKCQHCLRPVLSVLLAHGTPFIVSNQHLFNITQLSNIEAAEGTGEQTCSPAKHAVFTEDHSLPAAARVVPLPTVRYPV